MSKANPIRLGIVGLGRAGVAMHLAELKGREDKFQVVAVCDLCAERREAVAREYGCKAYARIEDLLSDPNVEMADIATRSIDHFDHAVLALKSGKDVFHEKPITVTYAQAKKLQAQAARSKGTLYIRHNARFEPPFMHVREICASGLLGDIYQVRLFRPNFMRRNDWQTLKKFGGGLVLNWGPHLMDHALEFLESPVKGLWSDVRRIAAVGDAEDHFKVVLRGTNGRLVDIEVSGGAATRGPEYTIWGTRGGLTCQDTTISLRYLDPKAKLGPRKPDPGNPAQNWNATETLPWIEETVPVKYEQKFIIWDKLYDAVRKGKPYPISLARAVDVMKYLELTKKGTPFAK